MKTKLQYHCTMAGATAFLIFGLLICSNVIAKSDNAKRASPVIGVVQPASAFEDICDCYFNTDCAVAGGQEYCNLFICDVAGKLDGVCFPGPEPGGGSGIDPLDLPLAASSVGDYFKAFLLTVRSPDGVPTPEAVDVIRQAQESRLSIEDHLAVQAIFTNILDRLVGFDLVYAPRQNCGAAGKFPAYRGVRGKSVEALLHTVGVAVTEAITSNDPRLIAQPIRTFWRNYPEYHPNHSGRCYPHGHDDYPYDTPANCQIEEIQAVLRAHLPVQVPKRSQ